MTEKLENTNAIGISVAECLGIKAIMSIVDCPDDLTVKEIKALTNILSKTVRTTIFDFEKRKADRKKLLDSI